MLLLLSCFVSLLSRSGLEDATKGLRISGAAAVTESAVRVGKSSGQDPEQRNPQIAGQPGRTLVLKLVNRTRHLVT